MPAPHRDVDIQKPFDLRATCRREKEREHREVAIGGSDRDDIAPLRASMGDDDPRDLARPEALVPNPMDHEQHIVEPRAIAGAHRELAARVCADREELKQFMVGDTAGPHSGGRCSQRVLEDRPRFARELP